MCARDYDELNSKAASYQGSVLTFRRQNLETYLTEARQSIDSSDEEGKEYWRKLVNFLQDRIVSNDSLWAVYYGQASKERIEEFFEISRKTWVEALPKALGRLEEHLGGPYLFGDQIVKLFVLCSILAIPFF